MTSLASTSSPQSPVPSKAPSVALVGNPNTGKTALFNQLTGARQKVGNYPGVTVDRKSGRARIGKRDVNIIDLPGTYSMAAVSTDERVVVDVLSGRLPDTPVPDLIVCVVDATNMLRNLLLASQIADTGIPMIVCLNMWDEAKEQGIEVDLDALSEALGVPLVTTVARSGEGVDRLRDAIDKSLDQPRKMKQVEWPAAVAGAIDDLKKQIKEANGGDITQIEAQRLLFDSDSAVADRLPIEPTKRDEMLAAAREALSKASINPSQIETTERYHWIGRQLSATVTFPNQRKITRTESIDAILTHRVLGLVVFAGIMYAVFWSIYTLAGPFMDAIDSLFGWLGEVVGPWLAGAPMIQALVVDGIIAGVGGVVIFLPQILILFFFICLLEDTGYMARAAFLMDKLFSWTGLNGKSFVPMLSGYACAIPGIMGARTIEDPKARLTTILITPLMSCSARLPVYVLLIGAFIEPRYGAGVAAFCLFFMHILGLILAVPIAWIFNKLLFKAKSLPFILEMPPYRVPRWRDVIWRMYLRGREFVLQAGTIILAMSIVIWALTYFPRPAAIEQSLVQSVATERGIDLEAAAAAVENDEKLQAQLAGRYIEQSYMGRIGKTVQPVFAPAGYDWKITVSVLASFPAREVIVSTLGIIYNLGGDVAEDDPGLLASIKASKWPDGSPVFTVPVAFSIMVFFALCMQCGSTVAVIAKESNWRWAVFSFTYMTVLAWVGAVVTYQVGTALMA